MKIKTMKLPYSEVKKLEYRKHKKPVKPNYFLKKLILTLSKDELKKVGFTYDEVGMEKLSKDEPCLILMNHSSFIDLKIAETIFKDRDLQIVCTSDGFVGKEGLMRHIGCIPTQKFVTDTALVKDLVYCFDKLHTSVLLFPEASYSFDGTATPLPESLCKLVKVLKVPVIFIETFGAFHRDPLYNGLRLRDVKVSAKVSYILSPEDAKEKSAKEINEILNNCFSFDYFKWQKENNIKVTEDFRTLGLERALYKCPCCQKEGMTMGTGVELICESCEAKFSMDELGRLSFNGSADSLMGTGVNGALNEEYSSANTSLRDAQSASPRITMGTGVNDEFDFSHIPDWYRWQRQCVREEIERGEYKLDIPVEIRVLKDMKAIYEIGDGRLVHDSEGFRVTSDDGELDYTQNAKASYSLYSDYFWYELGDMICVGDNRELYYCFPKEDNVDVAKARLATEEMYKIRKGLV